MLINPENKEQIARIAKEYNLEFVTLFGSQATGRTHSESDVDIAVISWSEVNLARLEMDLCEALKRRDIQVVNLAKASPTLMFAVCRDGILLYEEKPDTYIRWKVYATKVWMDTEWLRNLRDKKLREWSQEYSKAQKIV